jgi:hypothetical protein
MPPALRQAVAAAMLLWTAAAPAQTEAQPKLQTINLQAGMHVIRAEVALTPAQRASGLMFRREMGASEGMFFAFPYPGPQCFWMRNTVLPLTIAFVDDDGTIVELADMQPLDERNHCSSRPVRYALEMNQGWFAKRGIKPGFKLKGPPFGS